MQKNRFSLIASGVAQRNFVKMLILHGLMEKAPTNSPGLLFQISRTYWSRLNHYWDVIHRG
jgi:hypothetical protein